MWCINSEAGGLQHAHRKGFRDSCRYTYSLNKEEAVCDIKPQLKVEFFGRVPTWVKTEWVVISIDKRRSQICRWVREMLSSLSVGPEAQSVRAEDTKLTFPTNYSATGCPGFLFCVWASWSILSQQLLSHGLWLQFSGMAASGPIDQQVGLPEISEFGSGFKKAPSLLCLTSLFR